MWTLLSAAGGLLGSAIPEIIHYFTAEKKKKRDLELFKLKKLYQVPANEMLEISARNNNFTGTLLVSIVRPAITFGFFLMFCFVKGVIVHAWLIDEISTDKMINLFWDPEARAFFAAVIGFWFGHRAFTKLRRH